MFCQKYLFCTFKNGGITSGMYWYREQSEARRNGLPAKQMFLFLGDNIAGPCSPDVRHLVAV